MGGSGPWTDLEFSSALGSPCSGSGRGTSRLGLLRASSYWRGCTLLRPFPVDWTGTCAGRYVDGAVAANADRAMEHPHMPRFARISVGARVRPQRGREGTRPVAVHPSGSIRDARRTPARERSPPGTTGVGPVSDQWPIPSLPELSPCPNGQGGLRGDAPGRHRTPPVPLARQHPPTRQHRPWGLSKAFATALGPRPSGRDDRLAGRCVRGREGLRNVRAGSAIHPRLWSLLGSSGL